VKKGIKMKQKIKLLLLLIFHYSLFTFNLNAEYIRDNNLNVVQDTTTGLMWQDNSDVKDIKKTWQGAIDYWLQINKGTKLPIGILFLSF
jgi:hypothetical protein